MEGVGPGGGRAGPGGAGLRGPGPVGGLDLQPPTQRDAVHVGPYVLNYFSRQIHPGVKKPPGSSRRKEKEREGERREAVLRVYLRDDLVSAQRINARLCLSLIKP